MRSYVNKEGVTYYLPEFGAPVRWLSTSDKEPSHDRSIMPSVFYFECDGNDLGCRAIQLWRDGRVMLANPGGPNGDRLPEGALPKADEWNASNPEILAREITEEEFNSLWCALSRIPDSEP